MTNAMLLTGVVRVAAANDYPAGTATVSIKGIVAEEVYTAVFCVPEWVASKFETGASVNLTIEAG